MMGAPAAPLPASGAAELARMADEPRPVDVEVGRRLKRRRTLLGMSQERLGELLGVTYQQVQKYERGVNRIGSSRLYDICRILDVPVSYFFDEVPTQAPPTYQPPPAPAFGGLAEAPPAGFAFDASAPSGGGFGGDSVEDRETLELVRAFRRIRDPLVRRKLYELAKALGELGRGPGGRTAAAPAAAGDPGRS
jgi:transcriptional regulator with XRE-family HTH domain